MTKRALHFLTAMGAAIGTLRTKTAQAEGPRLLVFLHLAIKQRALETMLQTSLSGIAVTAVGRIADFERALDESQDALLALPLVLDSKGLTVRLQGYRDGAPDEMYSLVGIDTAPDPSRVVAVGALDLLGREETTAFVHKLLGAQPKVERVTKVEDLLPLLQMRRVDAILLPSRLLPDIQGSSHLSLTAKELDARVKLPALAAIGSGAPQILNAMPKLPADIMKAMGVDRWR